MEIQKKEIHVIIMKKLLEVWKLTMNCLTVLWTCFSLMCNELQRIRLELYNCLSKENQNNYVEIS